MLGESNFHGEKGGHGEEVKGGQINTGVGQRFRTGMGSGGGEKEDLLEPQNGIAELGPLRGRKVFAANRGSRG